MLDFSLMCARGLRWQKEDRPDQDFIMNTFEEIRDFIKLAVQRNSENPGMRIRKTDKECDNCCVPITFEIDSNMARLRVPNHTEAVESINIAIGSSSVSII
jgi:hypothetical protein